MAEARRFERIGAHTHITGLGLKNGKALFKAQGMVGQIKAREAAGIVVEMIKKGKMAGRAVLLAGPPGTGKTAIAVAIAKELGSDVPFIAMSGSEIYSTEMKKTEVLMQNMRKAIGVRLREMREVAEGEVTRLDIRWVRSPWNPYQQIPEGASLTLETKDDKRAISIGQRVAMELINAGVSEGDVIMIDRQTGRVMRMGRSKKAAVAYDIQEDVLVDRPSGPVFKEREFVYTTTLHELDRLRSRSASFLSLFFGGREEITNETRAAVDNEVRSLVEEGRAEIIPGVLFIDEVHMLDIEAYSFLSRALESELAPIIILATNRGITKIRGTDLESPHGIPLDLLDRLLIITTEPYNRDEIREILKIRASIEGVDLEDDALERLVDLSEKASLRYGVQLLVPAHELAKREGREKVTIKDVEGASELFANVAKSVEVLRKYEKLFLA